MTDKPVKPFRKSLGKNEDGKIEVSIYNLVFWGMLFITGLVIGWLVWGLPHQNLYPLQRNETLIESYNRTIDCEVWQVCDYEISQGIATHIYKCKNETRGYGCDDSITFCGWQFQNMSSELI